MIFRSLSSSTDYGFLPQRAFAALAAICERFFGVRVRALGFLVGLKGFG